MTETVWPSGLRRWLQAPVRKGVGSNPTAVILFANPNLAHAPRKEDVGYGCARSASSFALTAHGYDFVQKACEELRASRRAPASTFDVDLPAQTLRLFRRDFWHAGCVRVTCQACAKAWRTASSNRTFELVPTDQSNAIRGRASDGWATCPRATLEIASRNFEIRARREILSSPGIEPGLSRPQRDVLTTRR